MTVTGYSANPFAYRYLQSTLINLPHGMFNRQGGISSSPCASLNVSYSVGDNPHNVAANRHRLKNFLGTSLLLSARQVHGDGVYCGTDITADTEVDGYDALVTDQQGVGLLIQQADCQALLMHDPDRKVIAAVHCGWRGSAINIIGRTIVQMQRRYRTDPAALKVAISPSLGPCCAEFKTYREELPAELHQFQESPYHFNFWNISTSQLVTAGVRQENIDTARICTACDRNYFSYRRSRKRGEMTTGRNGSAICLPKMK